MGWFIVLVDFYIGNLKERKEVEGGISDTNNLIPLTFWLFRV